MEINDGRIKVILNEPHGTPLKLSDDNTTITGCRAKYEDFRRDFVRDNGREATFEDVRDALYRLKRF